MKVQQEDNEIDDGVIITVRNNIESLPFDLMVEIFTRLPVKSLGKSRCVSKTWCSIINNRLYMDSFMSISLSRPRLLFGYTISHDGKNWQLLYVSKPHSPRKSNDSSHLSVVYKFDVTLNGQTHCSYSELQYASFRGFIFVCYSPSHRYMSMICNPTTRQIITLPYEHEDDEAKECFMYLGYDPSKNQYKVLRVTHPYETFAVEHSVCTLGGAEPYSSYLWRRVENNLGCCTLPGKGVCIDGVVYYISHDEVKGTIIVSFNVGSEQLSSIETPKKIEYLINHQGKLAGSSRFMCNDNCFTLWVLEDVKKKKWSQRTFVFPPRELDFALQGVTNEGELVFKSAWLSYYPCVLFYFDMNRYTLREVTLERIKDIDGFSDVKVWLAPGRDLISCDHVDNIISL